MHIFCVYDQCRPETQGCMYGSRRSGAIANANSMTFSSNFGGVANPMLFNLNVWPVSFLNFIKLKDILQLQMQNKTPNNNELQ